MPIASNRSDRQRSNFLIVASTLNSIETIRQGKWLHAQLLDLHVRSIWRCHQLITLRLIVSARPLTEVSNIWPKENLAASDRHYPPSSHVGFSFTRYQNLMHALTCTIDECTEDIYQGRATTGSTLYFVQVDGQSGGRETMRAKEAEKWV